MLPSSNKPLKITDDDLDRVVVGRLVALPAKTPSRPRDASDRPREWNGVAIAALVVAVAGIPLFGLVTGVVAVILGCIALARKSRSSQRGAGLAIGGIVLGVGDVAGWILGLTLYLAPHADPVDLAEFEPDLETLENLPPAIQRAMKANVLIEGRSGWRRLGAQTIGSGVILRIDDGKAYVVTNRHVVDPDFVDNSPASVGAIANSSNLHVKLVGQAPQPSTVEWLAPGGIDLAVISVRIVSADVQPAAWVADSRLQIGDEVFAIGNPHGLGWTHTSGAVSQFRQQTMRGRAVRVIQTNAAINPGNSGGGLYDVAGNLVGITTWTKDKRFAEGLSFAISFETLLNLAPQALHFSPDQ